MPVSSRIVYRVEVNIFGTGHFQYSFNKQALIISSLSKVFKELQVTLQFAFFLDFDLNIFIVQNTIHKTGFHDLVLTFQ